MTTFDEDSGSPIPETTDTRTDTELLASCSGQVNETVHRQTVCVRESERARERERETAELLAGCSGPVSYTHLRAHETEADL
eukprot:2631090-Rhodomonas_salina.1